MSVRIFSFVVACLFLYIFPVESAHAKCSDKLKAFDVTFPSSVRISSVPIGGVLAQIKWYTPGDYFFGCVDGDVISYEEKTGMEMSGISKVYKTNVEGVGIRFVLGMYTKHTLPYSFVFHPPMVAETTIVIELVRTGAGVGKNRLEFDLDIEAVEVGGSGLKLASYKGKVSTELTENNYMICSAGNLNLDVHLGKVFVGQVRSSSAAPKSFSFDVSCTGVPAGKPLPVKVYFDGDSPAAGTLNLSGRGSSGVAEGVVIGLENDKGVALPFDRANAIPVDWQSSQPLGEVFRFNGLAKYIPKEGNIQPGVANAVMTMVLEYN
ncbi:MULTISPECIES: fimbrial protein [unclassified Pseudomonas]|uniref:fimbrial protein n=1 Tax=unclassified Pseudomonas TaxID=196821 RepID=UPI000F571C67|nr:MULTISPECIES: fimbrial protein [unclassified Pseudomonas]AZF03594.1 hypothetical protein C4J94_0808 [Pseudomonas sp. R5-89-07]AZF46066.1 hypothetical protein C4J86_0813 [Pseudomonas sp. R2-7-07]